MRFSPLLSFAPRAAGFTLIELMIAVAIVAILAAVGLPNYSSYVAKSDMRSAQSDLMAWSLGFENQYQRTLSYPILPAGDRTDLAKIKARFTGWSPASTDNFSYEIEVNTSTAYTIIAKGQTGTRHAGCTIRLTHQNDRTSAGCKYVAANKWL